MAASFNRIIIVGNLTRDPEYKQLENGQAVCRIGIASNRSYRNRQTGSMVQEVCFVDIDVWGAQAESCHKYLQKGRQILVEGRLKFDQWQDGEGQNRSRHTIYAERVVFLANGSSESSVEQSSELGSLAASSSHDMGLEQSLVKKRSTKKSLPGAGVANDGFKDEPAFEDELPF